MTDDQIIALAESLGWNIEHAETNRMLILFACAIAHEEREACASMCEQLGIEGYGSLAIAASIRQRDPLANISKKNKRPLPDA